MATSLLPCVASNSRRSPISSCIGLGGLIFFSTIAGCRKSQNTPRDESVSVSGTITLDGQPLKAGAIVFHSVPDENSPVAPAAYGYIEDGHYRIDAESGPAAGKVRVEFRGKPVERVEFERQLEEAWRQRRPAKLDVVRIPENYGSQSDLTVELEAGVDNRHDFALYSDSRSK